MKNKIFPILVSLCTFAFGSTLSSKAQPFQNMDFETDLGTPISSSIYTPGDFYNLPGWKVNTVGDQYGATSGGIYGGVGLLDGTYGYIVTQAGGEGASGVAIYPLDGNQSVALYVTTYGGPASISITQTGVIPKQDHSVSFLLGYFGTYNLPVPQNPLNFFSLSINNQSVPLNITAINGQILTVAGNISQWAGQSATLSLANSVTGGESFGVIDDIQFSPTSIPEPAPIAVIAASMAVIASLRSSKKRQCQLSKV